MSPVLFYMTLYTESVADQTDHSANAFVRENVAYGYDVMTFESLQQLPFCLYIYCYCIDSSALGLISIKKMSSIILDRSLVPIQFLSFSGQEPIKCALWY